MNYDQRCREDFKVNKGSVFAWIIMASFGYYHLPENPSLLSDEVFDKMCKYALNEYDNLEHKYKSLVTKGNLQAGSLFDLALQDYPEPLVGIYRRLVSKL